MNAIVHADYAQQGAPIRMALSDDRIEIENPGLLPFGLTIEDVLQGVSRLRNRAIGRVFHELRPIEQWGSGIQRMSAACQQAGLEAPRLERNRDAFPRDHFQHAGQATPYGRDEPAHPRFVRRWSGAVDSGPWRNTPDFSQRATLTRLKSMTARGLLVEIGTGPHDPKRQYVLA